MGMNPAGGWWSFYRRLTDRGRREGGLDIRLVSLSMALTVVCTMPLMLLGALSVQMRAELGYSIVALGGGVAVHRIGGALVSIPLGKLSDRLGPATAMRLAAIVATTASLGVAVAARDFLTLAIFLAMSGASNALGQTAANLALARAVPPGKQGLAFGVKQAALPVGSLLAGLTVPVLALTVGWRWGYVLVAVIAVGVFAAVPRGQEAKYRVPDGTVNRTYGRRPLIVMAVALFFGMAAASSLTTFIVEASTASGVSPANAGLLLTFGSALSIIVRLSAGHLADRREGRHILGVARMQLTGMVGFLLIATGRPWALLLGSAIAFAFGWGFNGLFWFAIVRLNPATPAKATGMIMPGGMLGGVAGPLLFGVVADRLGYAGAWTMAASWSLLAGCLMLLGRRSLATGLRSAERA